VILLFRMCIHQLRIKLNDIKDRSYEELECVFHLFRKCLMKILLGDLNAKVGIEDILNQHSGMRVSMKTVMIMVL